MSTSLHFDEERRIRIVYCLYHIIARLSRISNIVLLDSGKHLTESRIASTTLILIVLLN
uniref:AlNc14C45G3668 protein n=1 Tax=Albugo laibachii Nc14 TaxID=890382 RepID=F0WAE0_9STRA|nr:AlNc14C45G3668 [Albugo laibachii Nc14]|eukprot:CCA18111.1 AlNc14C45G3668 [Albugo laibachii Nc14]